MRSSSSRASVLRVSSSSLSSSSFSAKTKSSGGRSPTPTYLPGFSDQPCASISFAVAALHSPAMSRYQNCVRTASLGAFLRVMDDDTRHVWLTADRCSLSSGYRASQK